MRTFAIVVGVFTSIVLLSVVLAYNIPSEYRILISADDNTLAYLVLNSPKGTRPISMIDSPFSNNLKILTLSWHPRWGIDKITTSDSDSIARWLYSIGIRSYPDSAWK